MIKKATSQKPYDYLIQDDEVRVAVELKQNMRSVRDLHASFVQLLFLANSEIEPFDSVILLLDQPRIQIDRITTDWTEFYNYIADNPVKRRIHIVCSINGNVERIAPYSNCLHESVGHSLSDINNYQIPSLPYDALQQIITRQQKAFTPPKPNFKFTAVSELMRNYLLEGNPYIQKKDFCERIGCSYPTLSIALNKILPWCEYDSSKSIRLKEFPEAYLPEFLKDLDDKRSTFFFEANGQHSRSMENIIQRLNGLNEPSISLGGVIAASKTLPALDLIGIPRLDILVHALPQPSSDGTKLWSPETLASKLDLSLTPTDGTSSKASVAIRYYHRKESHFTQNKDSSITCDPLEAFYDLYALKFYPQAEQLLTHLKSNHPS